MISYEMQSNLRTAGYERGLTSDDLIAAIQQRWPGRGEDHCYMEIRIRAAGVSACFELCEGAGMVYGGGPTLQEALAALYIALTKGATDGS